MNYKLLFLSALCITWSSCLYAQQISELELELNRDTPNCINAKKLLLAVDSDTQRLNSYSTSITEGLQTIEDLQVNLNNGCDNLMTSYTGGSFLETASNAFSTMTMLQQKLKASLTTSGISTELKRKLGTTIEILSEISSDKMETTAEEAVLKCEEGRSRLLSFSQDLNKVLASLKQTYLESLIPSRREEIQAVLTECPITQTGLISKSYLGTGNEFEQRIPRARFQDYKITFDKPFTEVPSVALSLSGFDMDTELPAVVALVQRVTENDFTLRVHVVPYARLYSIQVSYLATLPESSGIHPKLHMIDIYHDDDLKAIAETVGPRSIEKKVPLPKSLDGQKVGVVTYLNGFSFGSGADPRLKVSVSNVGSSEFTLRYSTAGSTRFLSAVSYNLVYKSTGSIISNSNEATPMKTGKIYTGFGSRSEEAKSLVLGNFKAKPEVFVGLFAFDFTTGYPYRIAEQTKLETVDKKSKLALSFETAGDSKINMVKSSIFYTCHTKAC